MTGLVIKPQTKSDGLTQALRDEVKKYFVGSNGPIPMVTLFLFALRSLIHCCIFNMVDDKLNFSKDPLEGLNIWKPISKLANTIGS